MQQETQLILLWPYSTIVVVNITGHIALCTLKLVQYFPTKEDLMQL